VHDRAALVHVVGESDTGLRMPRALTDEARRARLSSWHAEIVAADAAALPTLLRRGWAGDLTGDQTTPLPRLLGALGVSVVDLVLVAGPPESDGVPSGPVADGLKAAFTAQPVVLGPRVATVRIVTATGFDDDGVAGSVRDALDGSGVPVVMSWGSGSTGIALGTLAGVVEAGRPWSLRDSFDPARTMSLLPEATTSALAPWLLRLGYPGRVVELSRSGRFDPPADPEVVEFAERSAALLADLTRGRRGHEVLAEFVRCELRRRDHGAALAVRSWLEARYRAYVSQDRKRGKPAVDLLRLVRRRYGEIPLGEAIGRLKSLRNDRDVVAALGTPSGRWLLAEAKPVNERVKDRAHRGGLLPPATVTRIERLVREGTTRFGPSTGVVRFVWPVGTPSRHAPPYAQTLLATPLDARILTHTGRAGASEVELHATLLTSSPESAAFAAAQREQLDAAPESGFSRIRTDVVAVGDQPRGPAVATAAASVRAALDAHSPQPDVVVVAPVGPKPVVAAAFAAAVEYGREHAIPVLVECTDLDRTSVGYHRVGAYLGADDTLADLALNAARQLDLDTAARLLDLGSPALRAAGVPVRALARDIADAVRRGERAALLTLFRTAVPEQPDRVGLLRLTHVAGTHAPRSRLRTVRDRLPTAHGDEATPDAAKLEQLIDHARRGLVDPRLADAYRSLLVDLGRLTSGRHPA
jgi:hypothetical protein